LLELGQLRERERRQDRAVFRAQRPRPANVAVVGVGFFLVDPAALVADREGLVLGLFELDRVDQFAGHGMPHLAGHQRQLLLLRDAFALVVEHAVLRVVDLVLLDPDSRNLDESLCRVFDSHRLLARCFGFLGWEPLALDELVADGEVGVLMIWLELENGLVEALGISDESLLVGPLRDLEQRIRILARGALLGAQLLLQVGRLGCCRSGENEKTKGEWEPYLHGHSAGSLGPAMIDL
jgi:hypothetical protein